MIHRIKWGTLQKFKKGRANKTLLLKEWGCQKEQISSTFFAKESRWICYVLFFVRVLDCKTLHVILCHTSALVKCNLLVKMD